jgi:MFS family permease
LSGPVSFSGNLLATLRHRDFRNLWLGSFASYAGQWIQQATIAWLAYDMTGSKSMLGLIMGMRAIPMFLCAPFAGVAADRYDRRKLLMGSQLISALTALLFGIVVATGGAQIWHLFAFVLVSGVAGVLDRPARLTIIFDLVPRGEAMQAVAINMIAFSIARITGPAIAGYLIAWVGAEGNLFLQALVYAAAALTVFMITLPPREFKPSGMSALHDLMQGVRFAFTDPTARVLLIAGMTPFILLVPIFGGLLPLYAKDVFNAGPEVLGMLLTSVGVGGVGGSWLASKCVLLKRQGVVQASAVFVMSAGFLALAAAPTVALACAALVLSGSAEMVHFTSNQATLQMKVPESMRGRITSLMQLYPGFVSIGIVIEGIIADVIGIQWVTVGIAIAASTAMALLLARGGLADVQVTK